MAQTSEKSVLVTGAAGFIGRQIVARLIDRGTKVVATDLVPAPQGIGCRYIQSDVRDLLRLAPVVAQDCEAILHCGGISGPMVLADQPAEVFDINLRGTLGLLSLAQSCGLRRFVGLSSVSAYGDAKGLERMDEETPLSASNAYGTSKAASDLMIQSYASHYGLSATALRIGWVYGPGRVTDAILQPLIRSERKGVYRLASGADHPLQFVHIDDVVAAALAALDAPKVPSATYVITGDEIFTIGDIAAMIKEHRPAVQYEIGPGTLEGNEVHGRLDSRLAKEELGWRAKRGFAESLRAYVDWLQENRY